MARQWGRMAMREGAPPNCTLIQPPNCLKNAEPLQLPERLHGIACDRRLQALLDREQVRDREETVPISVCSESLVPRGGAEASEQLSELPDVFAGQFSPA